VGIAPLKFVQFKNVELNDVTPLVESNKPVGIALVIAEHEANVPVNVVTKFELNRFDGIAVSAVQPLKVFR
jgi:hypothetical protein